MKKQTRKRRSAVRQILDERGLSLQTGADLIGISRRTMAYYASGEHVIPPGMLYALEHMPIDS